MKYFGTDGIRGIPQQNLTVELAVKIGKAMRVFRNNNIIIGTDTRVSKDMLATALISGCLSVGIDVYFVDVIPTPGLIYLSSLQKTIGIMITASHNPFDYNGFKIVNEGNKLSLEEEQRIEAAIEDTTTYSENIGKYYSAKHLLKEYHKNLFSMIYPTHFKIAIDCANGATYQSAPSIFSLVSNQCIIINDHPNGININLNCGATHLDGLAKLVVEQKLDLGIAFDGDGDRIMCVDSQGNIIDGDFILYILASYYQKKQQLKHNAVVLTIMSNIGIIRSLNEKGIQVVEVPVGDKYVAEAMKEQQILLGGENSGHIILSYLTSTGDGMVVALELLRILEETNTTFSDWISELSLYPSVLQNVIVEHKEKVMATPLLQQIDQMKEELNQDCKIIVRPSGTENLIRVSVMAKTKELVQLYKDKLIRLIQFLDASG